MLRALRAALACALITLAVTGTARAAGGNYVFAGGTPDEQSQVRQALDASSFPWGVVPHQVVIHIGAGLPSEATPGQIWLDSNLVDSGVFSWGLVQHEYAHQVDFLMLSDPARQALTSVLGGKTWCWGAGPVLDHAQYGCERFASTLAWAFWPSSQNVLQPTGPEDESAALPPARFKALLGALLRAVTDSDRLATIQQYGLAPALSAPAGAASTPAASYAATAIAAPAGALVAPGARTVASAPVVALMPAAAKAKAAPATRLLAAKAAASRTTASLKHAA